MEQLLLVFQDSTGPCWSILKSEHFIRESAATMHWFALIAASPMAISLVTESVAFPHFKPGGNDHDHRRRMQNTRDRVQSTRVVD
jgi:hypothetical protein